MNKFTQFSNIISLMIIHHTAVNIYSNGIFRCTLPHYIQHRCILFNITVTSISYSSIILEFGQEFILSKWCTYLQHPTHLITAPHNDLLSHQHVKPAEHVIANVQVHFGSVISFLLTKHILKHGFTLVIRLMVKNNKLVQYDINWTTSLGHSFVIH